MEEYKIIRCATHTLTLPDFIHDEIKKRISTLYVEFCDKQWLIIIKLLVIIDVSIKSLVFFILWGYNSYKLQQLYS